VEVLEEHSGIDCYQIIYEYCPEGQFPGNGPECSGEINLFPGQCTHNLPPYEFNAQARTGIEELDGYGFWFKSKAFDVAGNEEPDKSVWETNISIYIPKLVNFVTRENGTFTTVRNGGKVATNRTVIVSVKALEDVLDDLNIMICHYEHALGVIPPVELNDWNCTTCNNVRECNSSITTIVSEEEDRKEVNYVVRAQNATAGGESMIEFLPPNAPYGNFYFMVYHHYLCNFLIKDVLRTILGSTEVLAIEVRNIQDTFDVVGLRLMPALAKFMETNSEFIEVYLNPQEEKIVYARLVPQSDEFALTIVGNSSVNPFLPSDTDSIQVLINMPADFSGMNNIGLLIVFFLAVLVYLKMVKTEE
jgi:hypothetical protein